MNGFKLVSKFKALPILRQETNSASKIVPKMKNLMVILIFIVNDFESMSKFPEHNAVNSNWHVDLLWWIWLFMLIL